MGKGSDAVVEGVAIAAAAARLAVRNHILVETISRGADFDPAKVGAFAQETLRSLAREQEAAAARAKTQRKSAWGKFSDPDGTHDYRDRDTRNLRKRHSQYVKVAARLRSMADDDAAVGTIVEAARDAAWGDVEANLQRRLQVEGMTPGADPDYARMREARMQALRLVDLSRLASQARRKAKADSAE